MDSIIDQCIQFFSKYLKRPQYTYLFYPVAITLLFTVGSCGLISGLFFTDQKTVQAKDTPISSFNLNPESKDVPSIIMVDISGAIEKPGLYELREGDRVATLIEKSGGFDKRVHQSYLAHSINLAQKLRDEDKIYIPFQGETIGISSSQSKSVIAMSSKNSLVNINSASSAELEELPGIGAVRAESIISGRPYKTTQELVSRKILTSKIFEDIKNKLTL